MSGVFNAALSKQIDMKKAKSIAKSKGITFGDLIVGVINTATKSHFVAQKDETETITIAIPFTFHVIPKKIKDYVFGNKMVSLTCYMNLKDKLDEAIKDAARMT